MAEIRTADIVLSLTGRDRGQLMLVVAEEGDFLLLANGRAQACEPAGPMRRAHTAQAAKRKPADKQRDPQGARPLDRGRERKLTEEDKPQWQKMM